MAPPKLRSARPQRQAAVEASKRLAEQAGTGEAGDKEAAAGANKDGGK